MIAWQLHFSHHVSISSSQLGSFLTAFTSLGGRLECPAGGKARGDAAAASAELRRGKWRHQSRSGQSVPGVVGENERMQHSIDLTTGSNHTNRSFPTRVMLIRRMITGPAIINCGWAAQHDHVPASRVCSRNENSDASDFRVLYIRQSAANTCAIRYATYNDCLVKNKSLPSACVDTKAGWDGCSNYA